MVFAVLGWSSAIASICDAMPRIWASLMPAICGFWARTAAGEWRMLADVCAVASASFSRTKEGVGCRDHEHRKATYATTTLTHLWTTLKI